MGGYWLIPSRSWKLFWITLASFTFYAFWDARFVVLLAGSAVVDFAVAQRIAAAQPQARKRWLLASILFNLGVLGVFKYAVFVADNARSLFALAGLPVEVPYFSIVLPVGISFYTFQTMSYTIDVYRGHVEPTRSFAKYLAYVTLFPQLVAGPIVRYRSVSDQLDAMPRRLPSAALGMGLTLFTLGLAKKILVADPIAARVDPIWAQPESLTTVTAWLATLGYTAQLYFDFSGYSDMAIGLGFLLGLKFPINFRAPYQALNPSDFWRRWHISLSTFLRDYLYIPLGGNRRGARRAQINMLIVMLLGGLWHGAAWTFVVWGLYHGLLLAAYSFAGERWNALPVALQRGSMFLLASLGWVVFRSPDLATAGQVYGALIVPTGLSIAALGVLMQPAVLGLAAALIFTQVAKPNADRVFKPGPWRALATAALLVASVYMLSDDSPFLYYQF